MQYSEFLGPLFVKFFVVRDDLKGDKKICPGKVGYDDCLAYIGQESSMTAITYTKADWVAQADIQKLADGRYRGVVLISKEADGTAQDTEHTVEAASDSPEEALEEAKALAHRLLADVTPDERYQ